MHHVPATVRAVLVLVLLAAPSSAPLGAQGVAVGPIGGLGFTSTSFDTDLDAFAETEGSRSTGIAAGLFLEAEIGRWLSVEPQLLLATKGGNYKRTEQFGFGGSAAVDVSYVQMPVLLKAEFGRRRAGAVVPSVFVGPQLGRLVLCDVVIDAAGLFEYFPDGDCGPDGVARTEWSVVLGAGVDLGDVALQVRWDHGLTDLIRWESFDTPANLSTINFRNRSLLLTVAYGFRGR